MAGTAGPRGWPEPGCACASCLRLPRGHRRPTEVLVDGEVRLAYDTSGRLAGGVALGGRGRVVTAGDGSRLLYWPDPPGGAAPAEPVAHPGPFAAVLVEGPAGLAEARRLGLAGEHTHVVMVGLDHRIRSEEELARRSALWGARAVPDGTELDTDRPPPPRPPRPRRALLLGGSRSGKSGEAELRLAAEPRVTYVATGPVLDDDAEWQARLRAHRERRPGHWETVETTRLAEVLGKADAPLLVDGIGSWLATLLWEAPESVDRRCEELVAAWREVRQPVVAVSDEAGMGVVPATAAGRAFRDALGRLNQRLAEESEYVALVVAGRVLEF